MVASLGKINTQGPMPDIMQLLSCSIHRLDPTNQHRLARIVEAMPSMAGLRYNMVNRIARKTVHKNTFIFQFCWTASDSAPLRS